MAAQEFNSFSIVTVMIRQTRLGNFYNFFFSPQNSRVFKKEILITKTGIDLYNP